jgi:putative ABC transport system substrate-binding protein
MIGPPTAKGGAAVVWPLAARAQQGDCVRRIGVLMPYDETDPDGKHRLLCGHASACGLGLDRRSARMDLRWGGDINRIPALARELVACNPTSS